MGLLMLVSSSFSGRDNAVAPDEFIEVYNSNKVIFEKTETMPNAVYSIKYIPKELRLIDLNKKGSLNDQVYREFMNDHKNSQEFLLQIELIEKGVQLLDFDVQNEYSYTERLKYYAFEMKADIQLKIDDDIMYRCSDYVFEGAFGASRKATFTIGFDEIRKFKELEVTIKNKLIGNENVIFRFSKKDLNILPTLKSYKKWKN